MTAAEQEPLLEVRDLRVRLRSHRGPVEALRGLDFSLARGETLGLIGESGCGKSLTALALMGLIYQHFSSFFFKIILLHLNCMNKFYF